MSNQHSQRPPPTARREIPALPRTGPATGRQPNIIIINCDDLGYGDLHPYGGACIDTPNVDALAAGGATFTSFYSCNGLCTPSRFGLLTGRYPDRAGLGWLVLPRRVGPRPEGAGPHSSDRADRGWWWLARLFSRWHLMDFAPLPEVRGIPDEEITLADALRAAGYRTGMVGKWHLGEFPVYPEYNPTRHGFDFFFGVPHSNDMKDFALFRGTECLDPDFEAMDQLTGRYTTEALQFIRESQGQPFFLYFAHTYPHQPLHASDRFRGKSKAGRYGDTVEEIDWSLGELMQMLADLELTDNTLVVFTSDNGPWYNGNPGGLRGRKGQSYEGGFRIPMIAHWPGVIPAGRVCSAPAMNIDWFPTCLALSGLELPADRIVDGCNILPLLRGEVEESPHDCLYFYHSYELEAVRRGDWKYIPSINTGVWPMPMDKHWKSASSKQKPFLYNLRTDPAESYNLRDDHADVVESLDRAFCDWKAAMKANPGGWKKA